MLPNLEDKKIDMAKNFEVVKFHIQHFQLPSNKIDGESQNIGSTIDKKVNVVDKDLIQVFKTRGRVFFKDRDKHVEKFNNPIDPGEDVRNK